MLVWKRGWIAETDSTGHWHAAIEGVEVSQRMGSMRDSCKGMCIGVSEEESARRKMGPGLGIEQ